MVSEQEREDKKAGFESAKAKVSAALSQVDLAEAEAVQKELEALGSKHDWSHITSQIGMFAYTGLTPEQMDKLAKEVSFHVYQIR